MSMRNIFLLLARTRPMVTDLTPRFWRRKASISVAVYFGTVLPAVACRATPPSTGSAEASNALLCCSMAIVAGAQLVFVFAAIQ